MGNDGRFEVVLSRFGQKTAVLSAKSGSRPIDTGAKSYKLNSIPNLCNASRTILLLVFTLLVVAAVLQLPLQLAVLAA
jgi:hypothetical protein